MDRSRQWMLIISHIHKVGKMQQKTKFSLRDRIVGGGLTPVMLTVSGSQRA